MSLIIPISAIFGAALGSFLNVVILRYPTRPLTGRSHCPRCHRQLTAWDLIPVLSWIILRGQCRHCHTPISIQYPVVELLSAVAAVLLTRSAIFYQVNPLLVTLEFLVVLTLMVLFAIDLRTMLLPDTFIFILTALVLLVIFSHVLPVLSLQNYQPSFSSDHSLSLFNKINLEPPSAFRASLYSALSGAFLGAGLLLLLWLLTSKQGIGFGDVKLMVPLGLLFGPVNTILLLFVAFICGGFVGTYLLVTKQATLKTAVPFGPFLAGAAIIFILFPRIPTYLLSLII